MHGLVDHSGNLQARANYHWIPQDLPKEVDPEKAQEAPAVPAAIEQKPKLASTSKFQAQISTTPGQSVVQLEHDHQGPDFSLNFKAINPNPADIPASWGKNSSVTGIFSASYLQSISKTIAIGAEWQYQRPVPDSMETGINYSLRWAPEPKKLPLPPSFPEDLPVPFLQVNPSDPTEVFTNTFSPSSGIFQSTYWRKVNPRLEIASELQLLMTPGSSKQIGRRGGLASVGFKLETIYATIRGMVNSHGQVSTVLEEKIAPGLSLTLSAEIDYSAPVSDQGKVGFGFTLEA